MSAEVDAVRDALRGRRYRYANEALLHGALGDALTDAGIAFEHEVVITGGRIDFVIEGTIGMEVKVKGSASALLRQLRGYAEHPGLDTFIVATTKPMHVTIPHQIGDKPVHVVNLGAYSL